MRSQSAVAQHFSISQAAEFSGLSLAMVNYLCRHEIVRPSTGGAKGRGVQRIFSFGDLVVLRAIGKLLAAGVSVYRLRRALAGFRSTHKAITEAGMPASYLVTDGKDVYLRHKTGVVELLTSGQFGFAFIVEMESLRKEAVDFARLHVADAAVDRRRTRRA